MFFKGENKTVSGLRAIIAQIRPVGTTGWIIRGAIEHEDVLYIHQWDITGKSFTGHPGVNLLETEIENRKC